MWWKRKDVKGQSPSSPNFLLAQGSNLVHCAFDRLNEQEGENRPAKRTLIIRLDLASGRQSPTGYPKINLRVEVAIQFILCFRFRMVGIKGSEAGEGWWLAWISRSETEKEGYNGRKIKPRVLMIGHRFPMKKSLKPGFLPSYFIFSLPRSYSTEKARAKRSDPSDHFLN